MGERKLISLIMNMSTCVLQHQHDSYQQLWMFCFFHALGNSLVDVWLSFEMIKILFSSMRFSCVHSQSICQANKVSFLFLKLAPFFEYLGRNGWGLAFLKYIYLGKETCGIYRWTGCHVLEMCDWAWLSPLTWWAIGHSPHHHHHQRCSWCD